MLQLNEDCLVLIFNKLRYKELYPCLLVNREWCQLVVPILWKKYSHHYINESIVNTILYFLPSSSKQLLSDNDIKLPTTNFLKPPSFNYISFCEIPTFRKMDKFVNIVLRYNNYSYYYNRNKSNILEIEIYKLFISQSKNVKRLQWLTSLPLSLFPGASTSFSQLYSLSISLNHDINSSALYEMAKICKDLGELEIFYGFHCSYLPGVISLIDAQRNLLKVKINHSKDEYGRRYGGIHDEELSKALARKGNTINDLYLSLGTIPPSFLTSLNNLTQLSIYHNGRFCGGINEIEEFQQYLAISEFPNLQCLSVDGSSCFKELAMLIEKTKGNILSVRIVDLYDPANSGILIKSIANNCPKINYLRAYFEPNDFIHVKSLLLNCKQLTYVIFDIMNNNINNNGDELLDIFAKFSPKSLDMISIRGSLKYSIDTFEKFFESFRESPLDHFNTIHNIYITESHKFVVRKYINEGVIRSSNG